MNRWERRIERAAELEAVHPSAAELLRFYREVAQFQSNTGIGQDVREHLPALLDLVRRKGTAVLAERASWLMSRSNEWENLFATSDDPAIAFFLSVIEQPYFERQALQANVDTRTVQSTCPFCFARPAVAVLRPEGEGGRRTLLCGSCFTEWEFRRLLCPECGEENRDKLPVYTAAEFPHLRVDACDNCRHYIKTVDLTRDGKAVPEVDDLASLALDLWAEEHGYERLAPNLFT